MMESSPFILLVTCHESIPKRRKMHSKMYHFSCTYTEVFIIITVTDQQQTYKFVMYLLRSRMVKLMITGSVTATDPTAPNETFRQLKRYIRSNSKSHFLFSLKHVFKPSEMSLYMLSMRFKFNPNPQVFVFTPLSNRTHKRVSMNIFKN